MNNFDIFTTHLYSIIPRLSGFIFTKYGPVLLGLSLHLQPECSLGSSDADCELTGPRSPGVTDEPALVPDQSEDSVSIIDQSEDSISIY